MIDKQQQNVQNEQPEGENKNDWLSSLPGEAQDYIKNLRKEAAERRVQARELEKQLAAIRETQEQQEAAKLIEQQEYQKLAEKYKTDFEALRQQYDTERINNLKLRIAAEYKLPMPLATRLQGANEDELRADAEQLSLLIPGTPPASDDPARSRQQTSAVPDGQPAKETDAQKRARLNPRLKPPSIFDAADIIVHGD